MIFFGSDPGAKFLHLSSIMRCHGTSKLPESVWSVITLESVKTGETALSRFREFPQATVDSLSWVLSIEYWVLGVRC